MYIYTETDLTRCTLPLCQRNRKRAFLFQKSSLLAGAVGFEPTTKVLETHVWRACRPPGTEFHITPPNWSFKSDFQSLMNIIEEFLHLTRGHNKGPKDPRGKSCLFGMPSRKHKQSPSTHKSESMGFAILILYFYNFSTQKNVIWQPMHDPLESGTSTSVITVHPLNA